MRYPRTLYKSGGTQTLVVRGVKYTYDSVIVYNEEEEAEAVKSLGYVDSFEEATIGAQDAKDDRKSEKRRLREQIKGRQDEGSGRPREEAESPKGWQESQLSGRDEKQSGEGQARGDVESEKEPNTSEIADLGEGTDEIASEIPIPDDY